MQAKYGLFAAVAISLAVALGLFSAFTLADWSRRIERARQDAVAQARVLEEHTRLTLAGADLVLKRAKDVLETRWPAVQTDRVLEQLAIDLPRRGNLFLFDAEGNLISASVPVPKSAINVADHSIFRELKAGADRVIGPLESGRVSGRPLFSVSRPVIVDGAFAGVLVAPVYTDYFAEFYERLGHGARSLVAVVNVEGRYLLRYPPVPEAVDRVPPHTGSLSAGASPSLFRSVSPIDGEDRFVAAIRLGDFPVIVAAGTSVAEAMAPWWRNLWNNGVIVGAALIGLLGAAILSARWERRERRAFAALRGKSAELVRVLAERDLLLRELQHRVKNNLQLVTSLLSLASREAPKDARRLFRDTMKRIRAIAAAHEQLDGSAQPDRLDVSRHVDRIARNLLSSLPEKPSIGLDFEGEPIVLPLKHAQTLGIIVNELITNSIKHAFRDRAAGRIALRVSRVGDDVVLSVADDGVGLPAPLVEVQRSIGLKLVDQLTRQMGARCVVEESRGTRVTIQVADPARANVKPMPAAARKRDISIEKAIAAPGVSA